MRNRPIWNVEIHLNIIYNKNTSEELAQVNGQLMLPKCRTNKPLINSGGSKQIKNTTIQIKCDIQNKTGIGEFYFKKSQL